MNNFFRAVRLAFRRRWAVAGIVATSLLVAILWSINIATIYPLVEVVMAKREMGPWVDKGIKDLTEKQAALEAEGEEQGWEYTKAGFKISALKFVQPAIHAYVPSKPFAVLVLLVGLIIVGTAIKVLFLGINIILVERVSQLAVFELRSQFYRRSLRMELQSFTDDRSSSLLTRITADLTSVKMGISCLFGKLVREPLKMITCLMVAAMICWRLLVFSLLVTPIAILLIAKLAQSIKRANRRAMDELTTLHGQVSESLNGIMLVKASTAESQERRKFHTICKEYFRKAMRIVTYNALIRPTTEVMGMGVICVGLLAGGYLVLNEQTHLFGILISTEPLSLGALVMFYGMLIGASDPARKLADVFQFVQRGAAAADRVYEMYDREPAIVQPKNPVDVPEEIERIEIDSLHFHYHPEQPVLRNLSLNITAGECVALVGSNGCGKSSLVNLVPRLYDPQQGTIRVNGENVRDFRIQAWRNRISIVTQQTFLFDDSVFNNIRYGCQNATAEEVYEAAKQAHAHDFIVNKLESGYDTEVGEGGTRLSGGQRQRIALARAMLRKSDILILDEATSQIDVENEQQIHEALRKFMQGRTTLMITHRTSALSLADRIVVIDKGIVVDQGSHLELLSRCSLYRRLYDGDTRASA